MKRKLKFVVFLIVAIIIASFLTSCSNEIQNSEYVLGFIINENSLEYGEKVKIFEEKNGKVKVEFEDGSKASVKIEYVKKFDEMFKEINDAIFITNDTILYKGITPQSKTQINILKGMSLNRIYEGKDFSIVKYEEEEYFIENNTFNNSIEFEEINRITFIEEEISLYEYASPKAEILCTLKELSEVNCINKFDDYFFVEANGFFGYIKEVDFKSRHFYNY